uniref:Glycine zipper domain-containing protein n=1 Tax=Panagrolaimus davidi TaxID=227884 RepID=A0A914PQH9_9BILA
MENEKKNENIKNIGNGTLRFANESTKIIKAHNLAPTKYVFRVANGKANVLKIWDTTAGSNGRWAVRIDRGHAKGATAPHVNLNSKLTKISDPHIRVPNGAVKAAEFVNGFSSKMQSVNKILLPIAIAIDTARIGHAVYKDYKNDDLKKKPKETIKTTSSVAGGWSGGFLGGWAGGQSGTLAGGAIGACFGGVGAVPGAAIGCILGSITGAITGGIGGSFAAEKIAEKICDEVFDESKDSLDNIIIYITTAEKNHNLNFFAIDCKKAAVIEDLSFEISDTETFLSEFPKTNFKDKTKAISSVMR